MTVSKFCKPAQRSVYNYRLGGLIFIRYQATVLARADNVQWR